MQLFLTSSTITSNLVPYFEKFIKKNIVGLNAVFIPDAAYGVKPVKDLSWVDEERQFLIDKYRWKIKDLVLRNVDEVSTSDFMGIDIVFVNGGFSGYLAKEMRRVGFDELLLSLFQNGVTYVGSSAGSMVCSKTQKAAEWYIGEPEENASRIPGIGLVEFELYPHYEEHLLQLIEERWTDGDLYLLKDGEAIGVENKEVLVFEEKRIINK